MPAGAHTQILLYQYFKNDQEDPLAWGKKEYKKKEQASSQLRRMIQALDKLKFAPKVSLEPPPQKGEKPRRNYSYPQFEIRKASDKKAISKDLWKAIQENRGYMTGDFKFANEMEPYVSDAFFMTARKDQKADHLGFNQFLALVIELPFEDLPDLRNFLEKHNYDVLKKKFLEEEFWELKLKDGDQPVSSMPTYVLVGNENESWITGDWVMDIPVPFFNLHEPKTKRSHVERGYPYVNYIVHEKLKHFVEYDYEYIDLGLIVFLHGHLDRDMKCILQEQSRTLRNLMGKLEEEQDEEDLKTTFDNFRNTSGEVQQTIADLPEIKMMDNRLTQKYISPDPEVSSIFQIVSSDNKEFLENSVGAVLQGVKALQEQFLVLFEKRGEEHRNRVEDFLKVISAFAVVLLVKELWSAEAAKGTFIVLGLRLKGYGLAWPAIVSAYPGYIHTTFLIGIGFVAAFWSFLFFSAKWKINWFWERKLHWLWVAIAVIIPPMASILLGVIGIPTLISWLGRAVPSLVGTWAALVLGWAAAAALWFRFRKKRRSWQLLLTLAILPFYIFLVLFFGPLS